MDVVLIYFKEDGEKKGFPLKDGKTIVGRQEDCGYRIPLDEVSRHHCEFEVGNDGVTLRDLKSSNGTYVNNKRVAEAQIKPGDHVVVGKVVFTVQIDGNPPDPKPVKTRMEARKGEPTEDDIARDLMDGDDDDDTRKIGPIGDEGDAFDMDDSDFAPPDEAAGDDDSLGQALEALATGDEDADDPFADLDEDKD